MQFADVLSQDLRLLNRYLSLPFGVGKSVGLQSAFLKDEYKFGQHKASSLVHLSSASVMFAGRALRRI